MALGFWAMVTDKKKGEGADERNYKREDGLRGKSLELLLEVGGKGQIGLLSPFLIYYNKLSLSISSPSPNIRRLQKNPSSKALGIALQPPCKSSLPLRPAVLVNPIPLKHSSPIPYPVRPHSVKFVNTSPFTPLAFIINAVAKPPSKPRSHGGDLSGNAPGTGLFTLDDQHAPVELLMTPANTEGSNPSRCPSSMASATTICSTPSIKLLHILAASPDPAGPQ